MVDAKFTTSHSITMCTTISVASVLHLFPEGSRQSLHFGCQNVQVLDDALERQHLQPLIGAEGELLDVVGVLQPVGVGEGDVSRHAPHNPHPPWKD